MVLEVSTGMGILHQAPKPKALFFYPSWNLYIHLLVYLREDLYHSTFSGECKVYANKHVF